MPIFKLPSLQFEGSSSKSVEAVLTDIESQMEVVKGFKMVSKLSDGGVVTRTLAAPISEQLLFGHRYEHRIHFALNNIGQATSPFQPILRCDLSQLACGTRLFCEAKPHGHSMILFPFYMLTSIIGLGLSVFTVFNSQYYMGLFLVVISLGIFMVPRYRMRQGFKSDLQLLIKTLETLEFDWIENIHFETPISTDQSKSYS